LAVAVFFNVIVLHIAPDLRFGGVFCFFVLK
jgi:hypothetical protein